MTSLSPWEEGILRIPYPPLRGAMSVDVVVIGGGITGVTAAYELIKAGKTVALVEQGRVGGGVTASTTAHVTQVTDKDLSELKRVFGVERAVRAWKSGGEATDELERIVRAESIDCEFMRCPAYVYVTDEAETDSLREKETLGKAHGFPVQFSQVPLGFASAGHLRYDNQAKFHPGKYLTALTARIVSLGGQVFEETKVAKCTSGTPCVVKTDGGEITASHIVLATHIPFGDPGLLSIRLDSFQSYALQASIPHGILPEGLFWDTETPYHYFRVDAGTEHDRVILGGEDHRTGQSDGTEERFSRLEAFLEDLLPGRDIQVERKWSGQILETLDGLPYIGKAGKHAIVATGFSGNGMTYGILSGLIARDVVLERPSATVSLYRPFRLTRFWRLLGRVANFATGLVKGHFKSDPTKPEDLRPDEGAIVTVGTKKVAAYRTTEGKLLKLSPICTHMGCMVCWNKAGKSWDCPCHGSRFKKDGEVLNGPATKPLPPVE